MSMHLVGPYMTTTNYKKRKQKGMTKRDRQAQADHDKWLRKMGVHPEQLEEKKANRKDVKNVDVPSYASSNTNRIRTSDNIAGSAPVKPRNVYSGERQLLGVATMHKSNMVPIFADKKEDAKDIAKMRRG